MSHRKYKRKETTEDIIIDIKIKENERSEDLCVFLYILGSLRSFSLILQYLLFLHFLASLLALRNRFLVYRTCVKRLFRDLEISRSLGKGQDTPSDRIENDSKPKALLLPSDKCCNKSKNYILGLYCLVIRRPSEKIRTVSNHLTESLI